MLGEQKVFGVDDNEIESRIRTAEDFNNFSRFVLKAENSTHKSETSLDDAEFDYTIKNNGTSLALIKKVQKILIQEKII